MMIMPVSLLESVSDKKIIMKCILVSGLLFHDFCNQFSTSCWEQLPSLMASCNQDWPQSREAR